MQKACNPCHPRRDRPRRVPCPRRRRLNFLRVVSALIEDLEVFGLKCGDAVRAGLPVIDQTNPGQLELPRYLLGIDHPWQVRSLTTTIANRSGDSETGMGDGMHGLRQKFSKGTLKTRFFTAREGFLSEKVDVPLHDGRNRQTRYWSRRCHRRGSRLLFSPPTFDPSLRFPLSPAAFLPPKP